MTAVDWIMLLPLGLAWVAITSLLMAVNRLAVRRRPRPSLAEARAARAARRDLAAEQVTCWPAVDPWPAAWPAGPHLPYSPAGVAR